MHPLLWAAVGGFLIGTASWLLLASLGRIAGICGIAANAFLPEAGSPKAEQRWRWAFLAGLTLGGAVFTVWLDTPTQAPRAWPLLSLAGLLVGVGTVLGSGCTSGHGVCGLGRRSMRSVVATGTFMTTGIATVALARWLGQ